MPLCRCSTLYQCTKPAAQVRAASRSAKPLTGNSGRYLAVRNRASAYALSSLTRGREYEGFTPSQFSIASTVVALSVEPLSPCNTGLAVSAAIPSASAVRRTRWTAWSEWSLSCTSQPTILRLYRSRHQVQMKPAPHHSGGQIGHVPAPDLTHGAGNVGRGWSYRLGRFGASTVSGLPLCPQHTGETGLAGQVHALVSQHGHDARRRHGTEARFVGHAQQLFSLGLAQGMAGCWAHRLRPAIALNKTLACFPALQRAFINTGDATGQSQPGTSVVSSVDVMCQTTAIFNEDHASSPLLKIAVTFFDKTSKAAVSARARSLRSSSRSSILDARSVFAGGLWAGSGILRAAKRGRGACAPFLQLSRVDALLAAPSAFASLIPFGIQ